MQLKLSKNNQKYLSIICVVLLITINLVTSFYLYDTFNQSIWLSDDALHISAANSFSNENNFELNFILAFDKKQDIETILQYDSDISSSYSRGILHHMLLGSFYYVLDTQPADFVFHASTFSFILSSILIILFFFLIRKYFDIKIAIISSIFLVLFPYFAWESTRSLPTLLSYLFIISSLFFLGKKSTHYLTFGFFMALSHMTHPLGIVLGFSYVVYLLIHREFKGALITFFSWNVFLLPYYVRNYYFWQDIGVGLYLPFSSKLSQYLDFIPHQKVSDLYTNNLFSMNSSQIQFHEPFLILFYMFKEFEAASLGYLILILFISIFSFLSIKKLKQKSFTNQIGYFTKKYFHFKIKSLQHNIILVIFIMLILLLFTIIMMTDLIMGVISNTFYFYPNTLFFVENSDWTNWKNNFWHDLPTQSFPSVIGIILITIVLLSFIIIRSKFNHFIEIKSRYHSFIIYYLVINLFAYYYIASSTFDLSPANRHIMIIIYLLIPFSISGFNKLLNLSKTISSRRKILSILFVMLLFLPIGSQFLTGLDFFHDNGSSLVLQNSKFEKNQLFYSYLRDNYSKSDKFVTNLPADLFVRTGFTSVGTVSNFTCLETERFLDHFTPDYYVFYLKNNFPIDKSYTVSNANYRFSQITSIDTALDATNDYDVVDIISPEDIYKQKISFLKSNGYLQNDYIYDGEVSKSWDSLKQKANNYFNNNEYDKSLMIYEKMFYLEPFEFDIVIPLTEILIITSDDGFIDYSKLEKYGNYLGITQKEIMFSLTNSFLFNLECIEKKYEKEPEKYLNLIKHNALVLENQNYFNLAKQLWSEINYIDNLDKDLISFMQRRN